MEGGARLFTKTVNPWRAEVMTSLMLNAVTSRGCAAQRAFNSQGRYIATLVGDRLVYRSTDSAVIEPVFAPSVGSTFAHARAVGVALLGDEPDFDR